MRTVGVKLIADIGDYLGKLREAGRATRDFAEELDKAAKAGALDRVADSALRAGAALTAGVGLAITAGARFEQQMSGVAAATGLAGDELSLLAEAARKAGADTQYSAAEAAGAITELAKAGVEASDILSGGLTGALALAASGQIDVGEAAEIAASAMTQFGLSGKDVMHIADLLAAGAGKAQGGVIDMAYALKQAGLVASQTGLSIEETTGTLTAFAAAGLLGSDAGTSMRTMLLRLAAPTGEAARLMKDLGIEAFDARGEFVGMVEWAGRLERGLAHMTDEQRQATLAVIFGQDAIRAANVVYAQGEEGIRRWIEAVNDQGFATRQAAALTDNLMGDIERLTGSLETLFITSSEGANSGLRVLVQMADFLVDAIGAIPSPILNTVTVLGGLTGASLLAFGATTKLKASLAEMNAQLAATGPLGTKAAAGLTAVTRLLTGPWGIALTAGTALLSAFGDANDDAAIRVDELSRTLDVQTGAITRNTREWVAKTLEERGALDLAKELGLKTSEVVDVVLRGEDAVRAYTIELARHNRETRTTEEGYGRFAGMISQLDTHMIVLARDIDTAREKWIDIDEAMGDAEDGTNDLRDATNLLTGALDAANEAGQQLIDTWEALFGAQKSLDEEMIDAYEAAENLGKIFRENGPIIEGNTEAAVRNRQGLYELSLQAHEAAAKVLEMGGSHEDARAVMEIFKEEAYKAADAIGLERDKVDDLINRLFAIPKNVTTTVTVHYLSTGSRLAPDYIGAGGGFTRRWGGYTEHAQTGLLREAGIYSAQFPARYAFAEPATGGEAFVPKFGDKARSLAVLDHAAGWYGADVVPRGAWYGTGAMSGGATGGPTNVHYGDNVIHITVPLSDLDEVAQLRDFLDNLRNNQRRGVGVTR